MSFLVFLSEHVYSIYQQDHIYSREGNMKIVIPGGSGQLGHYLRAAFASKGNQVVVLSRAPHSDPEAIYWDGRTLGDWASEMDGADVVINLAGRSVNCRYTDANLHAMMASRVDSTRAIGLAIQQSSRPPRVWLQMSTATIYAHRFDAPNDESTGIIGGDEPGVPPYWSFSIDIAKAWELAQHEAATPGTRKVALRSAMVMGRYPGGVFRVLDQLTRLHLGGAISGGRQFVSWIHERDFARSVEFLMDRDDVRGPVNLTAPTPVSQAELMATLRTVRGKRLGLPASKWMVEIGAALLHTDTELILKSRRVVPKRLLDAGFKFDFETWEAAATDLVRGGSGSLAGVGERIRL
jgi:uncharacterized protein (TIGR01777 family)